MSAPHSPSPFSDIMRLRVSRYDCYEPRHLDRIRAAIFSKGIPVRMLGASLGAGRSAGWGSIDVDVHTDNVVAFEEAIFAGAAVDGGRYSIDRLGHPREEMGGHTPNDSLIPFIDEAMTPESPRRTTPMPDNTNDPQATTTPHAALHADLDSALNDLKELGVTGIDHDPAGPSIERFGPSPDDPAAPSITFITMDTHHVDPNNRDAVWDAKRKMLEAILGPLLGAPTTPEEAPPDA